MNTEKLVDIAFFLAVVSVVITMLAIVAMEIYVNRSTHSKPEEVVCIYIETKTTGGGH